MIYSYSFVVVFLALLCLFQSYQVSGIECGRVKFTRGLVRGGNIAHKGEWPFIVALYEVEPSEYFCGGTVISNKHVLTAAHCVHRRNTEMKLLPDNITVRLGAYNLTAINDKGSIQRYVTEIFVHPDWKPQGDNYDGDIAILVLIKRIHFNSYIQAICMPANDDVIDGATINVDGTVVGWGFAENIIYEEVPRKIVAKAVSNSFCFREDNLIIPSSSKSSFCAKSDEGTPNKGDSGGGFFVISRSTWVQYGIISAIRTNESGYALANSFGIYTNVQLFKTWIVDIVKQSGGEVGEPSMNVTLTCHCVFRKNLYECFFDELEIFNEHIEVVDASCSYLSLDNNIADNFHREPIQDYHVSEPGHHDFGFLTSDSLQVPYFHEILKIDFLKSYMHTFPNGLGKIFENVEIIQIGGRGFLSLHLKHIRRSSLKNFTNLKEFFVGENDIEILDEDCLWDLPNLRIFSLINNKLKVLHDKSFEKNEKLTTVELFSNKLEFLPKNLFRRNLLLNYVNFTNNSIKRIDDKIFETNLKLQMLGINFNHLDELPGHIFRNNKWLDSVQLENNSLTSINESIFESSKKLKGVSLANNHLGSVPKNLFKNNRLLEIIQLHANLLTEIDEQIFWTNIKLKEVTLSVNRLESLPEKLFKNNSLLEEIHLSENSLKTIDEKIFETNFELKKLGLESNQLESLHRNLFKNNLLLEEIYLHNNLFKTIDEQIFETNKNLRVIGLSMNQLEYLPRNLFKNNLFLEDVILDENSLKVIETEFHELENIVTISLHFNICIDAVYSSDSDSNEYRNLLRNMTEFQNLLIKNCSSNSHSIS